MDAAVTVATFADSPLMRPLIPRLIDARLRAMLITIKYSRHDLGEALLRAGKDEVTYDIHERR